MDQLENGDKIELSFDLPAKVSDKGYSHFLMGKGYYQIQKNSDSSMQLAKLLKFKKEGGFSAYSFKRFNEMAQSFATN